jgi:hypothetical protein
VSREIHHSKKDHMIGRFEADIVDNGYQMKYCILKRNGENNISGRSLQEKLTLLSICLFLKESSV